MSARGAFNINSMVPVITGGGGGIGLGLAEYFLKYGSPKVLLTDINEELLKAAADRWPGKVHTLVNDVTKEDDRVKLLEWIKAEHSECNALVNNAGMLNNAGMDRAGGAEDNPPWPVLEKEITLNLAGPIHLSKLFIPYFLEKTEGDCMLVNNSSLVALIPYVADPVYSATKAGLHGYTESMRYLLEDTHVRVVEILPPAVKTPLLATSPFANDPNAVECDEFCEHVVKSIEAGDEEISFGEAGDVRFADRGTWKKIMVDIAQGISVPKYSPRQT